MRIIFITIFLISISVTVFAVPVLTDLNYILQAPPKTEDSNSLYYYLNTLYQRWNTLQVTTQEPNANIEANYGNIIVYYDGSNYWLSVQTTTPSGTVWKGVKLGAV